MNPLIRCSIPAAARPVAVGLGDTPCHLEVVADVNAGHAVDDRLDAVAPSIALRAGSPS